MTIGLIYLESFPKTDFERFENNLNSAGLDCEVVSRPELGPFLGIEAYIPTAILLWISAKYFGPMVEQVGKDHIAILKTSFGALYLKFRGINPVVIGSKGKVDKGYLFSMTLSIEAEGPKDIRFKLLLERDLGKDDVESTVNIFLEFMKRLHADALSSRQEEELSAARVVGRQIIVIVNLAEHKIEYFDPFKGKTSNID